MPPVIARVGPVAKRGNRWGVILAGGDGVRLRPLTKLICGDDRPKQFCPLFDGRTLLAQTLLRAELTFPPEQLMVSLTSDQCQWYSREAGLRPSQRVVQPANKGTAPAILHSLLSLARLDARALVAILPCDHHYSNEQFIRVCPGIRVRNGGRKLTAGWASFFGSPNESTRPTVSLTDSP